MPSGHCTICLSHYAIDQFQIFPCGHCFCTNCTTSIFSQNSRQYKCPNCRTQIRRGDHHGIFIEVVDTATATVNALSEGLDRMGPGTPSSSVKRASQKLASATQGAVGSDQYEMLLRAVDDFQSRIIPLFTTTEAQAQKIESLTRDLQRTSREREKLKGNLKSLESIQTRNADLVSDVGRLQQSLNEAVTLADLARSEAEKFNQDALHWKKDAAKVGEENKEYKSMLDRQARDNKKLRKEREDLLKDLAKANEQLNKLKRRREDEESDGTHGYDGDFSSHEHSVSTFRPATQRTARPVLQDENIVFDMQGIATTFQSDWQMPHKGNTLKKRSAAAPQGNANTSRRDAFPISMDERGRLTKAARLGPRQTIPIPY